MQVCVYGVCRVYGSCSMVCVVCVGYVVRGPLCMSYNVHFGVLVTMVGVVCRWLRMLAAGYVGVFIMLVGMYACCSMCVVLFMLGVAYVECCV